jgi:hypothetical protein
MPKVKSSCAGNAQEHIQSAKAGANPKWIKFALTVVKRIARCRSEFTSADVLERMDHSTIKTGDLRAIGPVMLQASKLGYIRSAGLVRRDNRYTRGATVLWKSLIVRQRNTSE